jgi:uncharacterized protein (TIGR02996 family)
MTTVPEDADDHLTEMEQRLCGAFRLPLQAPLSADYANEFLLRFHNADDVRRWAAFILERLPEWTQEITSQWRSWRESTDGRLRSHRPFLDAIQADPESDVPRLAYADWLAEHGDPWSEVIRIQCRYPNGHMPWETADLLEKLLTEHQHRFDRGGDDFSVYAGFRRGMVEEIQCSAATFLQLGDRIWQTFPLVNVLSLDKIQGRGKRLAEQSALSRVRALKLSHLDEDDWQWIVRSPKLNRLEQLRVAFPRPLDLLWLLDMPLGRQLRLLDLYGSQLDPDGVAAFGNTDAVSGLETLLLADTQMDDEMARRLSKVATFRSLKRLSVADNPRIGIDGIAALLQAEFISRLEELAVGTGWFDDDVVWQLAQSRLSSAIRVSFQYGCAGIDMESFKKRFPNSSFYDLARPRRPGLSHLAP